MNLPNSITILRLLLVPVVAYALLLGEVAKALMLFLAASVSDGLDGYLARRLDQRTRLGAILDPLADKLLVVSVVILLTWTELLPLWLTALIILRDVIIVAGALIYHYWIGPVRIEPSYISKINTTAQFTLILLVLTVGAGWLRVAELLPYAFAIVFATTLLSGVDYVLRWSHRAAESRKRKTCK